MDIIELAKLAERIEQEAAERLDLLASLPEGVQAVLSTLPEAGRDQLLEYFQDIQAHGRQHRATLLFLGAVGYAFRTGSLDKAGYQCLCDFEQTLSAAPA